MIANTIKLKGIVEEDLVNYKYPSMFLITCYCTWKCCKEQNLDISICQNSSLAQAEIKTYRIKDLIDIYSHNDLTYAVVFGGLEPMMQFNEVLEFIKELRKVSDDPVIIYTGFYKDEIKWEINQLQEYSNIIIKFGRYMPNNNPHYDSVLGVNLISDNQYAEVIC